MRNFPQQSYMNVQSVLRSFVTKFVSSKQNNRKKRYAAVICSTSTNVSNPGDTSQNDYHIPQCRQRTCADRDNIAALRRQCEDLEADEAELSAKIKKKTNDLERGEKRLKSLQVRGFWASSTRESGGVYIG